MLPENYLNAIIVDDEVFAINNLKELLSIYCPSIHVIDTALDAESAAELINSKEPDVIFLDISMPNKNGFDLLSMLNCMPLVVFVTAYEKYALKALKASAFDFILKPVSITELKKLEEKLLNQHIVTKNSLNDENKNAFLSLLNMLKNPSVIKKISLPNSSGYTTIDLADLLYLEGQGTYTHFYLNNHEKIVVPKTLKEYEGLLTNLGFMRIHKSSIINLLHLKKANYQNGMEVVMSDGQKLPVSRRKINELLGKIKLYIIQ